MSVYIKGMDKETAVRICAYAGLRVDDSDFVLVPPHGDLIDRNKLYEKTAEWEAQALHMVEVTMHDEDTTEWKRWSAVLTERSAFKFDVADAPAIISASTEGE